MGDGQGIGKNPDIKQDCSLTVSILTRFNCFKIFGLKKKKKLKTTSFF